MTLQPVPLNNKFNATILLTEKAERSQKGQKNQTSVCNSC